MAPHDHDNLFLGMIRRRVLLLILVFGLMLVLIVCGVGVGFAIRALRTHGPLNDEAAAQAVTELQSSDPAVRRAAAERLANTVPDPQRREIARALRPLLTEQDLFTRQFATKALGKWGTAEDVPALAGATKDDWPNIRFAAIEALGHIKGRAAAVAVAPRLADQLDRPRATQALKAIGPDAEPAVLPLMEDKDNAVRLEACRILGTVGTKASIPALEKATTDSSGFVAGAARDALKSVQARQ